MNQESKTVIEWLEKAKVDGFEWADAAINNCDKWAKTEPETSLPEALKGAFWWKMSPEGDSFWRKIYESLK